MIGSRSLDEVEVGVGGACRSTNSSLDCMLRNESFLDIPTSSTLRRSRQLSPFFFSLFARFAWDSLAFRSFSRRRRSRRSFLRNAFSSCSFANRASSSRCHSFTKNSASDYDGDEVSQGGDHEELTWIGEFVLARPMIRSCLW